MEELNIAGIAVDSVVDGPGIRVAVFCQGCIHYCAGCHNPESHSFEPNRVMSVSLIYDIIKKNPLCRGVTFSGGEPFCQPSGFFELAKRLKADGYEIACYSGYTFEELATSNEPQQQLLSMLDVLIDGRFELEKRNLSLLFKGSSNQRIIDVQKSLKNNCVVIVSDNRWVAEV